MTTIAQYAPAPPDGWVVLVDGARASRSAYLQRRYAEAHADRLRAEKPGAVVIVEAAPMGWAGT
jgi:hypothetical protein